MSTENLKKLAAGLVVLLVIWGGLTFYRRSSGDPVERFRPAKFDPAAVTSVVIARPADTVTLARTGGGWTVNGLAASAELADALVKSAADTAASGEVIAESKNSYDRLGLGPRQAKRITFKAGEKTLATYLLGNRGGGFEAVYLRREGEDRVWEVKNGIVEGAERRLDDWRDKRILTLVADSIGGIDVRRGKASYSLVRNGAAWSLGGAPADSAAVSRLLAQFTTLTAAGFPTEAQADSADFAKPRRTLTVRGKSGQQLVALAFDSTTAGFLIRKDGQSTVYRIDAYTADQVTPADSTLRPKTKSR